MVILDVDDFEAEKKRVEDESISIVWNADRKKKIYMLGNSSSSQRDWWCYLSLDKMIPEDAYGQEQIGGRY